MRLDKPHCILIDFNDNVEKGPPSYIWNPLFTPLSCVLSLSVKWAQELLSCFGTCCSHSGIDDFRLDGTMSSSLHHSIDQEMGL